MRMVFGVLGLLVVVAIVGILAKKQLGSAAGTSPSGAPAAQGVTAPTGTPKQQVEQVKQSVESAMQQAPRQSTEESK